jgi:biotin transport system substrate-specific component
VESNAATLRLAVVPRSGLLTDAVLVLGGAGLVGLAAQISFHLGFTPVPITFQTFAVLLVGASLGSLLGATSLVVYLVLGAVGVPWYSSQSHGWHVVTGPTGGYLVGFIVAAAVTGWLAERHWDRRFSSSVTAMLTATVIIYAFGAVWLHHKLGVNWNTTLLDGVYPFVPGDLVKLYGAAAALPSAWKLVNRLKS